MVVAAGRDTLASHICKTATEYKILTIEQDLLARKLFNHIKIGDSNVKLPPDQMKTLDEVIMHAYGQAGRDFNAEYNARL